jgi:hypothetical protein
MNGNMAHVPVPMFQKYLRSGNGFHVIKNDIPSSRSRDGNENRNMAAKHGDVRGKREEAPAIPTGVGPWVGARKAGTAGRGV